MTMEKKIIPPLLLALEPETIDHESSTLLLSSPGPLALPVSQLSPSPSYPTCYPCPLAITYVIPVP